MSANEYMEQFSPHLFWDVRKEDIDLDAHAQYVIPVSYTHLTLPTIA